jgi:hypothetical protein
MRSREAAVSRAEIQYQFGVTSDEERTQEILERMLMLPCHGSGLEHQIAHNANCAAERQHAQNNDWIDSKRDDTDTSSYRRNEIHWRISLIESGIGQVHSG